MGLKSIRLQKTLPAPELPANLTEGAQWLAGEGAGSWFVIKQEASDAGYAIARYAPNGQLECTGLFQTTSEFDLYTTYEVTYPSHCQKVSIRQRGKLIQLTYIDNC